MVDLSSVKTIASVMSLILLLLGCIVMHFRLRTWPSFALIMFATFLIAINQEAILIYGSCAAAETVTASICNSAFTFRSIKEWADPILLVLFGLSFLNFAYSVAGPNNSFKPNPHQGGA
ncbi:MAG: hypothetical protein EON58_15210 [Alphaproteobacteria bacterium]|nr:MAG: hypothetical protein EON58_15210 [Alphaproteobacteria bacterium]